MTRIFLIIAVLLIVLPVCVILFLKASPARLAAILRILAGSVLLAVGTLLTVRGQALLGGPIAFFGFMLLSRAIGMGPFGRWPLGKARSKGQQSSVRTKVLAMELDHDSGNMDGEVLTGAYEGQRLSDLTLDELVQVMEECIAAGDQSQALLEAFLDRNHPSWRETESSADGGGGAGATATAKMSVGEAFEILGLEPGASRKDIVSAHRRMMKQYHPDQGGSDYLAARINQAKDLLLGD